MISLFISLIDNDFTTVTRFFPVRLAQTPLLTSHQLRTHARATVSVLRFGIFATTNQATESQ
jgi:hypothetical protein